MSHRPQPAQINKPFRILALDGGGAKGFYTLGILSEIEAMAEVRVDPVGEIWIRPMDIQKSIVANHMPPAEHDLVARGNSLRLNRKPFLEGNIKKLSLFGDPT
jgi:hypothetical protein